MTKLCQRFDSLIKNITIPFEQDQQCSFFNWCAKRNLGGISWFVCFFVSDKIDERCVGKCLSAVGPTPKIMLSHRSLWIIWIREDNTPLIAIGRECKCMGNESLSIRFEIVGLNNLCFDIPAIISIAIKWLFLSIFPSRTRKLCRDCCMWFGFFVSIQCDSRQWHCGAFYPSWCFDPQKGIAWIHNRFSMAYHTFTIKWIGNICKDTIEIDFACFIGYGRKIEMLTKLSIGISLCSTRCKSWHKINVICTSLPCPTRPISAWIAKAIVVIPFG